MRCWLKFWCYSARLRWWLVPFLCLIWVFRMFSFIVLMRTVRRMILRVRGAVGRVLILWKVCRRRRGVVVTLMVSFPRMLCRLWWVSVRVRILSRCRRVYGRCRIGIVLRLWELMLVVTTWVGVGSMVCVVVRL